MKIGEIKIYPVWVPFLPQRPAHKHAPVHFTNIVIEISDSKNRFYGFGEGCLPPHEQIFLEDWIKAAASFISVNTFPWSLNRVYDIQAYVESLPALSSLNPVVCAIETALLDVLGRKQAKPLSAYFPSHHATGFIHYAAAIPAWFSHKQTVAICRIATRLGIKKVRLGVGDDPRHTLNRLETVTRVLSTRCSIGLNPGFTWDTHVAAAQLPLLQRFPVHALEDPMPAHAKGLAELARTLKPMDIKLVAGQSAATIESAADIVAGGLHDTISVQLSRSGGFHRSLKLINYMRQAGINFQIGCHPAEACILSSAGHVLNLLCNDAVNREAACSKLMPGSGMHPGISLLSHGGGAAASRGTGLGMHVNRETVSSLKKNRFDGRRTTLTIKSAASAA
jgi:L-Ala-D/L-Glu epimerase